MLQLEELIDSYYSNKSSEMGYGQLIGEYNGRLFFRDEIAKVAVETRYGTWQLATIDKTWLAPY